MLEEKPLRSPLTQGGLEIKCRVKCTWTNEEHLDLLKRFIEQNYTFENRLNDYSTSVLESLNIEAESDEDEEDGNERH